MHDDFDLYAIPNWKFVRENAVPEEKVPLLTTGAILIHAYKYQGWTPQTLSLNNRGLHPSEVLSEHLYVNNKEEALKLVEDLISVGGVGLTGETRVESRKQIDERLLKYAGGEKSVLSQEEAEMLNGMTDWIIGFKWLKTRIEKTDFENITTTLAWDIERAAFVGRLAYNCDYLSEEEVWSVLGRTRSLAESNFEDWLGYSISFIKGISIDKYNADFQLMCETWDNMCLLNDRNDGDVWIWSPLK